MGTPFKMKGFSGFGNSPMKQTYVDIGGKEVYASGSGSSINISGKKGVKPMASYTLAPGISVGKFNLSGKYKGGFEKSKGGTKNISKTFTGGGAKFSFGSRPGTYSGTFKGSISGDYGTTKQATGKKTTGYSGRLDLGVGRSGSLGCTGRSCSSSDIAGYHLKAFGEHGSKGSYSPGTRVGISGRYGVFTGEGSYNLKTKKPGFNIGITYPINK